MGAWCSRRDAATLVAGQVSQEKARRGRGPKATREQASACLIYRQGIPGKNSNRASLLPLLAVTLESHSKQRHKAYDRMHSAKQQLVADAG